jgi:glycerophosphoryl diester phosphodiesterase
MIELDVQITKDKIPVIVHDFSVNAYLKRVRFCFQFVAFIHLSIFFFYFFHVRNQMISLIQ